MMPIQKYLRVVTIALAVLAAVTFGAGRAEATALSVSDGNSSITIDSQSAAGMHTWIVDGVDQMFQQWFWFRVGPTGGESSIDDLPLLFEATDDVIFDAILTRYGFANGLTIEIVYQLNGGLNGSGVSDVAEGITISNNGNSALDFHFFQYSDFDLCGLGGVTATFINANAVQQVDGTCMLSETVVTPSASHREAAAYSNLLGRLEDGSPTQLADNAGFGPGDATWAFQWDFILAPGGSFVISKDKRLGAVPEPASLLLLGSGLLGGLKAIRRRKKNVAA
jgi:hypothetical protein